jgi:hypothetical protein
MANLQKKKRRKQLMNAETGFLLWLRAGDSGRGLCRGPDHQEENNVPTRSNGYVMVLYVPLQTELARPGLADQTPCHFALPKGAASAKRTTEPETLPVNGQRQQ